MNIFRFVCIWILLTYAVKIGFNIYSRHKFYEWAKSIFAQDKMPKIAKLIMLNVLFLWVLTFYGTFFAYVDYGWILSVTMILSMLEVIPLVFFWKKVAPKFVKMLDLPPSTVWLFDAAELLAIVCIGILGFLVY